MSQWDDAVDQWTTAMRAAGRSEATIRLYKCHVRKVTSKITQGPSHVTTSDLREILAHGRWKPETRKSVRTVLVAFFRWLHGEGIIDEDPAVRLDAVHVPQGVARPAPDDVIHEALGEVDRRTATMILLAAYAGLRCAEIAQVHTRDWDGRTLYVTGKGGKTRAVPIVRSDLKMILNDANGWLFPGQIDGHLSAAYVSKLLARALPGTWTGHTLRHRCGTQMYAGTRDLLAVSAVLGHARPETTQRYVRLPDDALVNAIRAAA